MLNTCRFLLILCISMLPWMSHAQTISIREHENALRINHDVEYFVDEKGTMSLEDVLNKKNHFKSVNMPFSAGFSKNIYWFRFTLENQNKMENNWLLSIKPNFLDSVKLYKLNRDNSYTMSEVGDILPIEKKVRPLSSPFSLPIFLPNNEAKTFYIRLQTQSLNLLNLTLRTPKAEAYADAKSKFLFGIAMGVWLLLFFYSLVMIWLMKRKVYIISCIYLFGTLLNCLVTSGVIVTYIFPNKPFLVNLLAPSSVCLVLFGLVLFFMHFFDTRRNFKHLHWILITENALITVTFISLFTNQFSFFAPIMHHFSQFVFFVIFYICWKSIKIKIPGSKSLLIGLILLLITNTISQVGSALSPLTLFDNIPEIISFITTFIFIFMLYYGLHEYNKKLEEDKIKLKSQIDMANQAAAIEKQRRIDQSNFINLVTHELKTPITIIDSVLQTLKIEKIDISPALSARHSVIKNSVEDLNALINKTLIAESLELKPFSVKHENIHLFDFIQNSVSKTVIPQHQVEIEISKHHKIQADPDLFFLMISNLLVNAKKYKKPDSKIFISAKDSLKDDKEGTSILFSNDFDSEKEPDTNAWFKKYQKQLDTPSIQGFGLGLYLVKAVTEAHSGYIECHTEKVESAWKITFDLWLPSTNNIRSVEKNDTNLLC